jgi:predicted neuraminidase
MDIAIGERRFLFDGALPFASCHASSVVPLEDGSVLVACFAGQREGAGDTAIWMVRLSDGHAQPPRRLFAKDGAAHWNPVLHRDGRRIVLYYKVGDTVHDWITWTAESLDGGDTWSPSRPLVAGDPTPRGPVKNKVLVLANGDWLAPASVEDDRYWDAFVDLSCDGGRHWHRIDVPLQHQEPQTGSGAAPWTGADALWDFNPLRVFKWDGVIQPTLWESAPGQVHMLLRSTRGRIWRADSANAGRDWTAAYATALPNNNSGIDLCRLANGRLILACNPVSGNWSRRSPLSLTGSWDNGLSWSLLADVEDEEGEFSYPALVAGPGHMHLTYTWNRRNIVYRPIAAGPVPA